MFGAILGDMVGSPYEFDSNNIKSKDFPLFSESSTYTDDTVLTLAIGQALMNCPDLTDDALVSAYYTRELHRLGNLFPDAGYGYRFAHWLASDDPKPYHSYGNGAAMRVSAVGWIGRDLSEVRRLAHLSAAVTHDHPEGIKGAEAVACAIFLARQGQSKDAIRHYISAEFGYDLSQSCAEIRPYYHHVESCQETVPQALAAFFEGGSFEDVLRTAVSLGGDSDTLAAIAASIAEAYYGIDEDWKKAALCRLPAELAQILRRFDLIYGEFEPCRTNKLHEAINFAEKAHRGQKRKGTEIAYITHPLEVMQILTSMQASDDLLIAGVLHDTVEDTAVTIEDIRAAFGDRVAFLVGSHSEDKSKTWRERKQHTLDSLKNAERDVKLLVLADKVANLRSMLDDHRQSGERLWERFNAPKEQQAWYNGALQDVLLDLQDDPAARNIYWEMVDICKDLFAEYYADLEAHTLYQTYLTDATYAFRSADSDWEPYRGVIPPTAVRLPRLKAERLEDYWRSEQPAESVVTFDLGDITTLACDCIVNAANNSLLGGGGVDGAIHRAAGPGLLAECRTLHGCATGEAKITKGYDLPAKYVIHTVGPIYAGKKEDAYLLAACYRNSLELAKAYDLHSIAFPAISAGAYGYPLKEAAAIAITTALDWLKANPAYGMEIIFSCYDRKTFQTYQDIFYGLSE